MAANAGDGSLALGKNSLNVSTGAAVVGLGEDTLRYSPNASYALSVGTAAGMRDNGSQNVFVGPYAGPYYTELTGGYNTVIGTLAGTNIEGAAERNVGLGQSALGDLTTGVRNTAIGQQALPTLTTGSRNIAIGQGSGNLLTTGSDNILIGNNEQGVETGNYNVLIGKISGLATDLSNTIVLSDGEGNERMRVDSTGNVGIGTTTPSDKLDVHGVIAIDSAALIDKDGNKVIIGDIDAVDDIGFLDLNTADASTRLFLDDSGHVGINTDNPLVDLHVVGELLGNTDGDSLTHVTIEGERHHLDVKEVRTATLEEQDWKSTTLKLQLRVDSTNHQSIDFVSDDSFQEHIDILTGNQLFNTRFTADGKVGIGVTGPATLLTLSANLNNSVTFARDIDAIGALVHGVGTAGAEMWLHRDDVTIGDGNLLGRLNFSGADGGSYLGASILGQASGAWSSTNSKSRLIFETTSDGATSPTEKMRIEDDGNVGVGISSPQAKLDVSHTIRTQGSATPSTGKGLEFRFLSGDVSSVLSYDRDNTEYKPIRIEGSVITLRESSTDVLTVDGGNVGIGTTSPSQKLHVVGKALITDDVQLTGSNPRIDFNSNGASSLRFYDTNAALERMRINEDGNVGIGDSAPSFILDVNNADSRVRFKAGTGDSNLELSAIAGRDWLIGQSKADGEFRIYDEDAAAVRFKSRY